MGEGLRLKWPMISSTIPMLCCFVGVQSLSSNVWLFATPWTVAHQVPLSIKFSRQEYWSEFLCLSPGSLPNPGIEPVFPDQWVKATINTPKDWLKNQRLPGLWKSGDSVRVTQRGHGSSTCFPTWCPVRFLIWLLTCIF